MESDEIGKSIISAPPQPMPGTASKLLQHICDLAINGNEFLPGASQTAGKQLQKHEGKVDEAIQALVNQHIIYAGSQGFITNLGGILASLIGIPANLAAILVIQTRMVASVAHLRGYQIDDTRVRQAILLTLLGKRFVDDLVTQKKIPGSPLVIATAPAMDQELATQISDLVVSALLSQTGGKQLVSIVARRIPIIGGGVGAATDGYNTAAIARYSQEQFVNRRPQIRK